MRAAGSQMWWSWNGRRKSDPVDVMFRGPEIPTGALVVQANWRDNPWFTAELEQERLDCLRMSPDQYQHIWEGDYITISDGAYFAAQLTQARLDKRIGNVAADPLMEYRAFWDIGTRDATAIWVAQFVGREIRVIDYYEAVGQPLAAHLGWLRSRGYEGALCVLPHAGERADHLTADKFADHIEQAGFRTQTVKNQGKGAAMKRVEAARRLFQAIWFNETTTEAGRDALGWYHEKRDEQRNFGLGPEHDWSSHGADAFGLMCVAYEQPETKPLEFNFGGRGFNG
jgi:phage terminase large subunit